jgi:hypothetical protein
MSDFANVISIPALRELGAALALFQDEVQKAVAAADMEVQRAQAWIDDQLRYWQRAQRDCSEEVTQAKLALQSRKLFKLWDRPPDCTEQEEDLDRAQRRLEIAEEKIALCKKWRVQYLKDLEEFEAPVRRLQNYVDLDLERGKAQLDRMATALETYTQMAPPALPEAPAREETP